MQYKDTKTNPDHAAIYAKARPGSRLASKATASSKPDSTHTITLAFHRKPHGGNSSEPKHQERLDAPSKEVIDLERSSNVGATTGAYIIGLIGLGLVVGAFVASTATGLSPLVIILSVTGITGLISSYFCYQSIRSRHQRMI